MSLNNNPFIKVTKKFSFDMAHALDGYDGPCKNIHGHTYTLSVTLKGRVINENGNPKNGMVLDFSVLKKIVTETILAHYDHALVLNENASYSKSEVISNEFEKVILAPYQPTCENLLLHYVEILQAYFKDDIQLEEVKLEETPGSYAVWSLGDNN